MTSLNNLENLLSQVADKPLPMARLACQLLAMGKTALARDLCARAVELAPDNGEVQVLAAEVFSHDVPQFYFSMVLDDARHQLYESAFRRIIMPHCRVLDIGSGTGLFAMMAARAGAGEVVTCEANPVIAKVVRNVVAHNGLSRCVRVVEKHSSDLEIGVDLAGPADVVVWDNLANNLIGAGALRVIEQVVRRLVRPGACLIPARGSIRIALVEDRETNFTRMGMVESFDMSPFNRLANPRYGIWDDAERFSLRSEAVDLFNFDFESGGPFPEARTSVLLKASGGRVNGVAQWLQLELDTEICYENSSFKYRATALGPVFNAIQPIATKLGTQVRVFGAHDRSTLRIWT